MYLYSHWYRQVSHTTLNTLVNYYSDKFIVPSRQPYSSKKTCCLWGQKICFFPQSEQISIWYLITDFWIVNIVNLGQYIVLFLFCRRKKSIRRSILKLSENTKRMKKSKVVLIVGEYGVGKSSFINSVLTAITGRYSEHCEVAQASSSKTNFLHV